MEQKNIVEETGNNTLSVEIYSQILTIIELDDNVLAIAIKSFKLGENYKKVVYK